MSSATATAVPARRLRTRAEWRKVHAYNLPGGIVRIYPDRSCRFFPHWCAKIDSPADRSMVARALWIGRAKHAVKRLRDTLSSPPRFCEAC